jgi:hypothetical protein
MIRTFLRQSGGTALLYCLKPEGLTHVRCQPLRGISQFDGGLHRAESVCGQRDGLFAQEREHLDPAGLGDGLIVQGNIGARAGEFRDFSSAWGGGPNEPDPHVG